MKKLLAVALVCALGAGSAFAGEEIRAVLLHLGHNLWCDWHAPDAPAASGRGVPDAKLRCQDELWRRATDYAAAKGCNMVVVDLGEGLVYPSHPELAVEGSWSADKMRAEVKRLREIGLEPIPKLNFSTTHNGWLKQYRRMVSTPTYYKVCEDLISDVSDIFDSPRLFHLGYDEETAGHQSQYEYTVVRQGELWWHDFLFFVKTVEELGMRPWIWSDYYWHHPELFLQRMPKSVLQSNWYYGAQFDDAKDFAKKRVQAYVDFDKAGFDQVPCGSNWSCDENFGGTVSFCKKNVSADRLKGYLMAPWFFTTESKRQKLLQAVDQVGAAMKT